MADDPDDDEPETFVQKAVKIGLVTIPIMMYVSWAYKKFVPCPKTTNRTAGHKLKNPKNKGQRSRCIKQENEAEWKASRRNEREPSKNEYLRYIKHSSSECRQGHTVSTKTDVSTAPDCSQSYAHSDTISPEAFDKLFEQHFEKCVDEFKQHKKQIEERMKRMKDERETEESKTERPMDRKKEVYLQSMASLNLDREFECNEKFYSSEPDTPYVVKDYNCKPTRGTTQQNETNGHRYLERLTEFNMDKLFEDKQDNREDDCCPKLGKHENHEKHEEEPCNSDRGKTGQEGTTQKKGTNLRELSSQQEDVCKERKARCNEEGVSNIYTKARSDDCGCNPHTNSIETNKYGTVKRDPCEKESKENNKDENALKDFWHACGPPKGVKTGCRAEGCRSPDK